jgi:hypothetical protein
MFYFIIFIFHFSLCLVYSLYFLCCVDSWDTKDLPEKLWGYNAGFSCKSFSKLHNDWKEMQRALLDNNEDSYVCIICIISNVFFYGGCTCSNSILLY